MRTLRARSAGLTSRAVVCAAALLGTALAPTQAHASKSFTYHSCKTAAGANGSREGWEPHTNLPVGQSAATANCAAGEAIAVWLAHGTGPWAPGSTVGMTFTPPTDLRIASVRYARSWNNFGENGWGTYSGHLAWYIGAPNALEYTAPFGGVAAPGGSFTIGTGSREFVIAPANGQRFNAEIGCWPNVPNPGCGQPHPGLGGPGLHLSWAKFGLLDVHDPVVSEVTGKLTRGVPHAGTEAIALNATDRGAGLYRTIISVDGEVVSRTAVDTNRGECVDANPANADAYEFDVPTPCVHSKSATAEFDTTSLPDGRHHLEVRVEDAAGNSSIAFTDTAFEVDNVVLLTDPRADFDGDGTRNADDADDDNDGVPDVSDPEPFNTAVPSKSLNEPVSGGRPVPVVPGPAGRTGAKGAAGAPAAPGAGDRGAVNGASASARAKLQAHIGRAGQRVVKVRYGTPVAIEGTLSDPSGRPIRSAELTVLAQGLTRGARLTPVGRAVTDERGRYRYLAPPGPGRTVRVAYRVHLNDTTFVAASDVEIQVIPQVSLATDKRVLRNKQAVVFRGTIAGAPADARKVVEMQAKVGKRWMTFSTTRLNRGKFAKRYRFTRTFRTQTYSFRARVHPAAGWPFASGTSKVVKVKVLGSGSPRS